MANLAVDLEEIVKERGETIECVILGPHYCTRWNEGDDADKAPQGVPLPWDAARPWLDETYSAGYGGADCRPFYAYTASRIYFVQEYDGATSIGSVPRNPTPEIPDFM